MKRKLFGLILILMVLLLAACGEKKDNNVITSKKDKNNTNDTNNTNGNDNKNDNKPNGSESSNLTWLVREGTGQNEMEIVIFDKNITPENYQKNKIIESISIFTEDAEKSIEILIENDSANGPECANVKYIFDYRNGPTDTVNSYISKIYFVNGGAAFRIYADNLMQEMFIKNADPDKMTCTVKYVDNCFETVIMRVVYKDTSVEYLEDQTPSSPDADAGDDEIGLLHFSHDVQYFTPKSDDYMYVITHNSVDDRPESDNYGKTVSQTASLIAFDADGNCIQYVTREYFYGVDMTSDSYYDLYNMVYDDGTVPDCRRDYTFNYKLQAIKDAGDKPYYLSKPLTTRQTQGKAICSKEDVFLPSYEGLLRELGSGEDYYISTYHYHEDEDISNRFIRYENYEPVNQKVRDYADIDYEKVDAYIFDSEGYVTSEISVYVFEDESGIDNWLKKMYGAYYDGGYVGDCIVDATLRPDFKFEDTIYTGRKDNLLYIFKKVEKNDKKVKWSYRVSKSENEKYYFSIQSLTDRQINNAMKQ